MNSQSPTRSGLACLPFCKGWLASLFAGESFPRMNSRGELPRTIRKSLNFRCTNRLVSLTGLFWEKEIDFSLINCHCMWKKHRNLQSVEGRPKSPPKCPKFASIGRSSPLIGYWFRSFYNELPLLFTSTM